LAVTAIQQVLEDSNFFVRQLFAKCHARFQLLFGGAWVQPHAFVVGLSMSVERDCLFAEQQRIQGPEGHARADHH
jgi:hypothetical protein